jgi:hypothetical protein
VPTLWVTTDKATNLKAVTIKATVIILTAVCVLFLQSSCPVFFSGLLNSQVAQRVRSVWAWRYGRGRPWTPSNFNRAHHALPFYVIENIKKTQLFCLWKKRWDFEKKRGCKKKHKKNPTLLFMKIILPCLVSFETLRSSEWYCVKIFRSSKFI